MNGLLLSLPGTPVIYYGDEIGMGDNIYLGDRDGVRTPMQWSGDRNAGFSRANPQQLFLPPIIDPEFHYETVNVETQAKNGGSLLWWMRRMLALRKRYEVFGRGDLEFLHPENRRVLAYLRRDENRCVLIVANLSRFAQYVELDLSRFRGSEPLELFGQTRFPPIGELPYLLTLGPHAVYWLALEGRREDEGVPAGRRRGAAARRSDGSIDAILAGRARGQLEQALQRASCRAGGGSRARRGTIRSVSVTDSLPLDGRPRARCPRGADRPRRVHRGRGGDLLGAALADRGRAGREPPGRLPAQRRSPGCRGAGETRRAGRRDGRPRRVCARCSRRDPPAAARSRARTAAG